jgi:protein involved in polysaccharide export with SLBB domain
MKKNKIFWSLCISLLLISLTTLGVFGQEKEKNEKETVKSTETVKPEQNEDTISDLTKQNIKKVEDAQVAIKGRPNDRYRIGFQDTLSIQVDRHSDLSQTVSVNPDGTIRLFRIDNPVVAVCKTERELAFTIETLYKNYLRNPRVNVLAVEQRSQPFAVMGAVQKPGSFFLNQRVRLLQLLSYAGGYDVEKAGSKIQVARTGNIAGCSDSLNETDENQDIEFMSFDLNEVIKGKQNPWMQPGDIVSVLEVEEAFVVGDVIEPAKVELKGQMTLTQAIAAAKGLDKNARTDKVTIERQEPGKAVKTELVFNLKDIINKKSPDPLLQANDIVVVGTDKGKAVTNSVLKALTGGIGNLFFRFPL